MAGRAAFRRFVRLGVGKQQVASTAHSTEAAKRKVADEAEGLGICLAVADDRLQDPSAAPASFGFGILTFSRILAEVAKTPRLRRLME